LLIQKFTAQATECIEISSRYSHPFFINSVSISELQYCFILTLNLHSC